MRIDNAVIGIGRHKPGIGFAGKDLSWGPWCAMSDEARNEMALRAVKRMQPELLADALVYLKSCAGRLPTESLETPWGEGLVAMMKKMEEACSTSE